MSKKIYQRKDQFSASSAVRLDVNGKSKTIIFESKRKNGLLTYETDNSDIQSAIEKSKGYTAGTIICILGAVAVKAVAVKTPASPASPSPSTGGEQEYPEVTEWQAAKEVLRSEPYNVPFQALNNPPNIQKKAEELGVSFPNLKE